MGVHKTLEVRRDVRYLRRCRLAFAAIVLSMPVVLAAWALTSDFGFYIKIIPMVLWLASSAIIGHFVFVRPLNSYFCPQCQRPLPRAEDARPSIRFRCESCGIDWDVERTDGSSD